MRPIRLVIWSVLVLAASVCSYAQTPVQTPATTPADPPAASDKANLTGLAAWDKVVGNTLVGMVEGRAFVEYYGKDGVSKFRIDGKVSVGRWQIQDDQVCFEYPGDPKECFRLTLTDGVNVTWSDGKGLIDTRGTLSQGNPENL
jgi:hypothetical protein